MTERTDKTDVMKIDNLDAPELDLYARLSETELLRLNEPDRGVFIAESPRVIERALQAGCVPISILCEERQAEEVQVRAVPQAPAKPAPVSRAPQQPGGKKGIVNIDSLSRAFAPGDVVTGGEGFRRQFVAGDEPSFPDVIQDPQPDQVGGPAPFSFDRQFHLRSFPVSGREYHSVGIGKIKRGLFLPGGFFTSPVRIGTIFRSSGFFRIPEEAGLFFR